MTRDRFRPAHPSPWSQAMYLNDAHCPRERPARDLVAQLAPDAVELCVDGRDGVLLVRELMRELDRIGRRDVSIVVRRMD